MTGLWLVSYIVLWVVVVIMGLLLIGVLRQLGLMFHQNESVSPTPGADSIPALEQDGPAIGSPLMDMEVDTINGFGMLTTAMLHERKSTLLIFLSPLCETCQHLVDPLNDLVKNDAGSPRTAVIIRGEEQSCRAFLSIFPLRMPVVCDSERAITMGHNVHRTPFGLLYDEHDTLIRKGVLGGREDLLALLGDRSAPDSSQENVFPRFASSQV